LRGLAVLWLWSLAGAAQAEAFDRTPLAHVTLRSVIRAARTGQLEPSETPQTTFLLDTIEAGGRRLSVLVELLAPIRSLEGDQATHEGDLAPAEGGFPAILLSPRILRCGG
jgi:hypothetical protein